MSLPNPGQDAVPFTTLTAQFYDETIANIEALAMGTGLNDAVLTNAKLATSAGEPGGAWNAYTMTYTNFSLGNGTVTYSKYKRVGNTVFFRARIALGSTSAFSGVAAFSLPVAGHSDHEVNDIMLGAGMIVDSGATVRPGVPFFVTDSTMSLTTVATLAGANPSFTDITQSSRSIQTGGPIVWSTGDVIQWYVAYEVAP